MKQPARISGFTLVETLVGSVILTMVLTGAIIIAQQAFGALLQVQLQARATALARDRIERAHNVDYLDLGTVGGIPAGTLPAQETVTVVNGSFDVRTFVVYVDDAFDGVAPTDVIPADYKRVRVEVTWDGISPMRKPVILWTDIAPKGLETLVGAGTLSVLVMDAQSQPVSGAQVTVVASSLVPPVNMVAYTDDFGRTLIPGAPVCDDCYEISVTKTGYTTDRTYSTTEVAIPNKPHASVTEGGLLDISFAIDRPATLVIRALNASYNSFAGVQFRVRGTKEIGRTVLDEPVYKYDQNVVTTGSNGQVTVSGLEWDTYHIGLPVGSSVDLAGSWPFSPVEILANTSTSYTAIVNVGTANSLLVKMLSSSSQPLASASAELANLGLSYIATKAAGLAGAPDWSQSFFSNLTTGQYDLRVWSEGYQEATASVQINGDRTEQFLLENL